MAEKTVKTEEQLIQEMVEKRERFSKGQTLGMEPKPKPNKEADEGAPKSGWRRLIENVTKDIIGK